MALGPYMTRGLTEREIAGHLWAWRVTFRTDRGLIEAALGRLGVIRARTGIWVPRSAREAAA
jgi:hypothetical protein